MKYFAISDTHGHHSEAIKALQEAGWDENNANHKLIVVGDITDRGGEALAHIEWLKRLTDEGKAIVCKGNHDQFILGFFKNRDQSFNWMHNGLNTTIDDLDHRTGSFETYCVMTDKPMTTGTFAEWQRITAKSIQKEYPWMKEWFENLPNYYETENYIFTHGIVDWRVDDWHNSQMQKYNCQQGWMSNHWASPEDFLKFRNYTGKKLVVGHLNASLMRYTLEFKGRGNYDYYTYHPENEIYFNEDINTYFIDTMTVVTKRVNVLVVDDEPLKEARD